MILDKIIERTQVRVEALRKNVQQRTGTNCTIFSENRFKNVQQRTGTNCTIPFVIAEVKKASPSKGIIDPVFDYLNIAREYEAAGVAAISVLTEPEFFMGSNEYLTEIKQHVNVPILRKDFIIDEIQIHESRAIGADIILLIAAVLETSKLREFLAIAKELGLSALVETRDEAEIESAILAGAEMIGVNNRNLQTFEVDIETSIRLRALVPKDKIFVSESGIETAADVERLRAAGVDGVLIGETLMRAHDKGAKLKELLG